MGEIAYMQGKKDDAIDYMVSHPAREAHLIGHRFLAMWSGGTPNPVRDFLRARSWWFRFVLLFNILVATGTLVGLVALIRRRSEYWFPLGVFPIVFPCAYYLTIVQPRYRLPIDPVLMLLTAIAIGEIARIAKRQSTRRNTAPVTRPA